MFEYLLENFLEFSLEYRTIEEQTVSKVQSLGASLEESIPALQNSLAA